MEDLLRSVRTSCALVVMGIALTACSTDDEPTPLGPSHTDVRLHVVPDNYASLASALSQADARDTVLVRAGIYFERALDVPPGVTLLGIDADSVVIDASDLPAGGFGTLNVIGDPGLRGVTRVQGLTLRGSIDRLVRIGNIGRAEFVECVFEAAPQGIYAWGSDRKTSVLIENCRFEGIVPREGGSAREGDSAVRVTGLADVEIRECLFVGNEGASGPAISALASDGSIIVLDTTFVGNSTLVRGGSVDVRTTDSAWFERCIFESNDAGSGGALYVSDVPYVTIRDCVFRANHASSAGGAAELWNVTELSIEGTTFVDQSCVYGGALVLSSTRAYVTGCIFSRNGRSVEEDDHGVGGAILVRQHVAIDVRGSIFYANRSSPYAGEETDSSTGSCFHAADARPYSNALYIEGSTMAFAPRGRPVGGAFADVVVRNSNVYGNADGDWVGPLAEFEFVGDNESTDPEYCDPENEDFRRCPETSNGQR